MLKAMRHLSRRMERRIHGLQDLEAEERDDVEVSA